MSSRSHINHKNKTAKSQAEESDRAVPPSEDTTSRHSPSSQPTLGHPIESQSSSDQPESGTNR